MCWPCSMRQAHRRSRPSRRRRQARWPCYSRQLTRSREPADPREHLRPDRGGRGLSDRDGRGGDRPHGRLHRVHVGHAGTHAASMPSLADDRADLNALARLDQGRGDAACSGGSVPSHHAGARRSAGALVHHRTHAGAAEQHASRSAHRFAGAGEVPRRPHPRCRYVEVPGSDSHLFAGDHEPVIAEIAEFITGERPSVANERILTTVLFTDIVGSTEHAVQVGDHRWRTLLDVHDKTVREQLRRHRGREINTTGDGFLACFDGPAEPSTAPVRSSGRPGRSDSVSGPEYIPASANDAATTLRGLRSTSRPGSVPCRPERGARLAHGHRPRRRIWHHLRGPRESTRSRASRTHGVSTPPTLAEAQARSTRYSSHG